MARGIHRLDGTFVMKQEKPGHYADGGGLYLQVSRWGTKSWVFKFTLHGRTRGMGLGPLLDISTIQKARRALTKGRDEAEVLRAVVKAGRDPIEERKTARQTAQAVPAATLTFEQAVTKFIARKEQEFTNEKHRKDWRASIDNHAVPAIGEIPVADITTQHVLRVLSHQGSDGLSLWEAKTETASRLRGRIEAVLSWATVAGHREGDNPARWAGNLKELLPKPSKVAKRSKQPALSQGDMPKWFAALRTRNGMAARALELACLCASRSGEVRGATWEEIDLEARVWRIPGVRMKMGREHRIPLSDAAVELIKALPRVSGSDFLFPAPRGGSLSDMALSSVMRKMHALAVKGGGNGWLDADTKRPAVPHGLRSTFRVWAAERGYDRDMAEMALAHNVGSTVERAYQRSDMLDRRRAMQSDWATFCQGKCVSGQVVQLRERGS